MHDNKRPCGTEKYRIIEKRKKTSFGLIEVYKRRELLWMLAHRQVASRYRQMLFGIFWVAMEPLGQLLILTIVFGYLLKIDTAGYPYPLFAFAGLIGWWLFSRNLLAVAGCLQDNMGLISKVYFPRLILPIAATLKEIFDSLIMVCLLVLVAIVYGYIPGPKAILMLLVLLYAALLGLAIGLWLASIMVRFRDVRPMLGLALQAGMYATPIVYAAELVPERISFLYELNPMYWVVELSRWALLEKTIFLSPTFYWSMGFSGLILISGLLVFSFTEKMAVDVQ